MVIKDAQGNEYRICDGCGSPNLHEAVFATYSVVECRDCGWKESIAMAVLPEHEHQRLLSIESAAELVNSKKPGGFRALKVAMEDSHV